MKLNINKLDKYIYQKYGDKVRIVHIFDKSLLSDFNLNGEMMISKANAKMIARTMIAVSPFIFHGDLEFTDPNK